MTLKNANMSLINKNANTTLKNAKNKNANTTLKKK